jgi:antirestriction protein ArdC
MNVALDTNAYSDFLRGEPTRVGIIRQADRIHLPLIVLGELRSGFAAGSREGENRAFGKRYGDDLYSREELVAEMTSAFLCAHCGLDNDVIQNQAAYLANWIKVLKAEPKLVIVAASQAQKAANLILGIVPEDVTVQPAEATA